MAVTADGVVSGGLVAVYMHHNRQLGALVELAREGGTTAVTEGLKDLAHEIALHVAAVEPKYLHCKDVPNEILAEKLTAFYQHEVLLEQPCAKDDTRSVTQPPEEASARLGERITISRFARFRVGEAPSPSTT